MAIRSGLSSQVGAKAEATYGTAVTVDRFIEFDSESIKAEVVKIMTRGLGQRFQRASRVRTYTKRAAGQLVFDIMNVGHGFFFKQILGAGATTHPATEYVHTFTPDAAGKYGVAMTLQVGRPDVGGTVRAFTYAGCKVIQAQIQCQLDQNVKLSLTVDGVGETTATALASASYSAAAVPLSFIDGALTIDAGAIAVKDATIVIADAQDVERRFIGNTRKEPVANGEMVITGTLTLEFNDLAEYAKFIAGTASALVLTFSYGDTGAGVPFSLVLTIPSLEYTGETPNVGSSGVVQQNLPFKALYNGTDPILTIAYTTTDALP